MALMTSVSCITPMPVCADPLNAIFSAVNLSCPMLTLMFYACAGADDGLQGQLSPDVVPLPIASMATDSKTHRATTQVQTAAQQTKLSMQRLATDPDVTVDCLEAAHQYMHGKSQ